MRVKSGAIINKSKKEINIKINNGHRDFMVELLKDDIDLDNLKDKDIKVRVYSMIRNCCAACPKYVLESGKNEEDDKEIEKLVEDISSLIEEGTIKEK